MKKEVEDQYLIGTVLVWTKRDFGMRQLRRSLNFVSSCLCDIEKVVYFVRFFFNVEEEAGPKGCS